MKKYIIAAVAALGIAVPVVAPAVASASTSSVTRALQTRWGNGVRAQAKFRGMRVTNTTVKCADTGGGYYTCYGTYTVTQGRDHAKFGTTIFVTPTNWRSTNGALIREW